LNNKLLHDVYSLAR